MKNTADLFGLAVFFLCFYKNKIYLCLSVLRISFIFSATSSKVITE